MALFILLSIGVCIILPLNHTALLKNIVNNKSTDKNTFINILCLIVIFILFLLGPK